MREGFAEVFRRLSRRRQSLMVPLSRLHGPKPTGFHRFYIPVDSPTENERRVVGIASR